MSFNFGTTVGGQAQETKTGARKVSQLNQSPRGLSNPAFLVQRGCGTIPTLHHPLTQRGHTPTNARSPRKPAPSQKLNLVLCIADGHTTSNALDLFRSPQVSGIGSHQYQVGDGLARPRGAVSIWLLKDLCCPYQTKAFPTWDETYASKIVSASDLRSF